MDEIIQNYYAKNAKKLHRMVDGILMKQGGVSESDKEDFYSLANEVFVMVVKEYDFVQSFEVFLYSCLSNRIKTEMTRRNRIKRKSDRMCLSIDMPVDGEDGLTLADMLPSDFDMDREVFEKNADGYSEKMQLYLDRLSTIQKQILDFTIAGYSPGEIQNALQITKKEYNDSNMAIHAYRNISVLF